MAIRLITSRSAAPLTVLLALVAAAAQVAMVEPTPYVELFAAHTNLQLETTP